MRSCLVNPCKSFPLVRIALLAVLTLLLSGWTTCTAIISLGCPTTVPPPVIISLSPDTVPDDGESVPLTVDGSDFVSESEIMWNGNALQTKFMDSSHLQATITPQIFDSFGGSAGNSVQISVMSQASAVVLGCPAALSSATLVLVIN